ncbi:MAG: hypothetical protein RLO51_01060 [Thalassobaculum sp.]|uniref:hypothetical protein n=1 Tax=Thalassobaculum sp. TaxID=2022740 RepID=UPI0032EB9F7D
MAADTILDSPVPEEVRPGDELRARLEAFDGSPDGARTLIDFATELWNGNRRTLAVALVRSAVCLDPTNLAFLTACGGWLGKLQASGEARTVLEIALHHAPDRKIAGRLAACYTELGRPEAAVQVLRTSLAAMPAARQLQVQLALILAEHGPADQARVELLNAVELSTDRATTVALAAAAVRLDGHADALTVWRAAGQPVVDHPPRFMADLGIHLVRAGDLLSASAALARALRRDPENLMAGLWLAWTHRQLGWQDEPAAVRYQGVAFDLARPRDHEALARLVAQNQHSILRRELVEALRDMLARSQNPVPEHLRLGLFYHGLLESQHAVETLEAAVRLAPNDVPCILAYARSLELDRRRDDVIQVLGEAIRRLPDAPQLLEELAEIQIRCTAPEAALEVARKGARQFPKYHPLHTIVAKLTQAAGLYAEACDALQTAFRLRQPLLTEVEDLALMQMVLGRHEEGVATLSEGVKATGRRQTLELRSLLADVAKYSETEGVEPAVGRLRRSVASLKADFRDFRRVGMLLQLSKAEDEADRAVAVLRESVAMHPGDQSGAAQLFYFLLGLNRISQALTHWLDTVRPLCGDRDVLPERPFQNAPPVRVPPAVAKPPADRPPTRTFGLVIQGPVTHRGFDCRDNIQRLVDDFGERFKAVVLSTWEGEADPGLRGDNCHALFSRDTTPAWSRDRIPLRNRVRQMLSTKIGLDHLRGVGGIDYVIKIRTDLHADLPALCDHVLHCERNFSEYTAVGQRNFIFTPPMQFDGPYLTGDVMFAGHIDDFENFLLATLETENEVFRPYKNLPESDVTLKHLYRNLGPVLGVPDYMNFAIIRKSKPLIRYPKGLIEYWATVIRHSLAPMPRRLFETAVFRGGDLPMSHLSDRRIDFETWVGMPDDWTRHAASVVDGWYDLEAETFDQAYFYYLEKAAEMAGVTFSGDLRRALGDYRIYVDKLRSALSA